MTTFIQDYYLIFMVVLLSLAVLILLRSIIGILVQLVFFGILVFVGQSDIIWLISGLFAMQIAGTLFVIYRLKLAIDYNFQLVLEKTHLVDRYYTKTDYSGSKFSFFK